MTAPPELEWSRWILRLMFIGGGIYGLIVAFKRRSSEAHSILEAYQSRDIPTRELSVEFRFITHDTTVQQVIDKAGPYSRHQKFPIDPRVATGGYTYTDDSPGRPAIVLFEWELPFHGAVLVIPDHPFKAENRIRAVYYRAPRPDDP